MKKISALIFIGLLSLTCVAQNYDNTWYFGPYGFGLDFNSGCEPTLLTDGQIFGWEGCITISDDSTGELLFYSNSRDVWDRTHTLMPNTVFYGGNPSNTQLTAFQNPGNADQYYIFTTEMQSARGIGLRYQIIDMTLNGGLGDVISKDNIAYADTITEKIIAIPHSNSTDIWLISHEFNSNNFISTLVTTEGVSDSPIVSSIGKAHLGDGRADIEAVGELKASPNGKMLAAVNFQSANVELFDFDNSTGVLSNLRVLNDTGLTGSGSYLYGLSFSPDNSKLYSSAMRYLTQYDLTNPDEESINASRNVLLDLRSTFFKGLKIGPNGKIYFVHIRPPDEYISVINRPNNYGIESDIETRLFEISDDTRIGPLYYATWGLNNVIERNVFPCLEDNNLNLSLEIETEIFSIYPNPTHNTVSIEFDYNSSCSNVELFSLDGRLISSHKPATNMKIDLSNLESGYYLIKLNIDGKIHTRKIVKD